MFRADYMKHVGWNLFWWFLIGTLALWIVLAMTARPLYGNDGVPAATQPPVVNNMADEMTAMVADFRAGRMTDAAARCDAILGMRVLAEEYQPTWGHDVWDIWGVLLAQANGQTDEAVAGWETLDLPRDMLVWKHVALTAANLDLGRIEEAEAQLDVAWMHDGANPLVHYYTALYNLELADRGREWFDVPQRPVIQLVGYAPRAVPNTTGMFRLIAIAELERALEGAPGLVTEVPLLPPAWATEPEYCPTVADVLQAIGAGNFEVQAHHMLGDLFRADGRLELAEQHLDAVTDAGTLPVYGYDELADAYAAQGRHIDAARAYAKAVHAHPGDSAAAGQVFNQLREALRDLRYGTR